MGPKWGENDPFLRAEASERRVGLGRRENRRGWGGGGAKVVAHVVARGSVEFARLETRSSCSNSNLDIVDGQAVKVVLSPLVAAHGALIEQ